MGIVTVMAKLSADAFGLTNEDKITCVGDDPKSFTWCVLDLSSNKNAWTEMQQNGFEFIEKTHSQDHIKQVWEKIVHDAQGLQKELKRIWQPKEEYCREGELEYQKKYPDVANALRKRRGFTSAFHHYQVAGK